MRASPHRPGHEGLELRKVEPRGNDRAVVPVWTPLEELLDHPPARSGQVCPRLQSLPGVGKDFTVMTLPPRPAEPTADTPYGAPPPAALSSRSSKSTRNDCSWLLTKSRYPCQTRRFTARMSRLTDAHQLTSASKKIPGAPLDEMRPRAGLCVRPVGAGNW